MNIIIIGSGRVGSAVARELVARHHSVTVIDKDADSLLRLGSDFPGRFEVGDAFDTGLLERVGIETMDALIVCSDNDNVNVVVAQIARRRYHVKSVVVRVFDPRKAEFYSRMGMRVVCPTLRAISEMVAVVEAHEEAVASATTRTQAER